MMNDMEISERSRKALTPAPSRRKAFLPRALLFCSATAFVALAIGVLLIDSNPEVESVIERGADAAADSLASTGNSGSDDVPIGEPSHSGSPSTGRASDSREKSIQRGEELIAETNSALAANPLPSKPSATSSTEFQSEVEAVREEITRLRNELRSSR